MANAIYPAYKTSVLTGVANTALNVHTGASYVGVSLLNGYTYSAAHQFFSSIATTQGTDQQITSAGAAPTVVTGTFTATDVLTWVAITGSQITNFVIYVHNAGANTTWPVVAFFDTSVTGLPVTPNGGNITLTWNASGIFTISDCRMKRQIVRCGGIGSKSRRLGLYRYKYAWERRLRIGLIAQEVERVLPQAVCEIDGVKRVNYSLALSWAMGSRHAAHNGRLLAGRAARGGGFILHQT